MTLEALLIIGALSGGQEAQNKTIDAYARYSGINQMIDDYGKKNPTLSFVVGSIILAKEQRMYYKIWGPFHHSVDYKETSQMLWFKKEF